MNRKMISLVAAAFAAVALDSCADPAPVSVGEAPRVVERIEYGVVESVLLYRGGSDSPTGAGAVLGGIAGGVIGHQIGGGRGKDVATVAGALGGAYVGNQVERSNRRDRYRVTVHLDNGARLEVEEVGEGVLRVGDRVRVVDGRVQRE